MSRPNLPPTSRALAAVPEEIRAFVAATPLEAGQVDHTSHPTAVIPERRIASPVPMEGEGGLFSQSWFPVCLSREVAPGRVQGFDFLDGRVVVWRDSRGIAHVTSAYCPHMGASLEAGDVQGDTVRCAFHWWSFGVDGRCATTGVGDAPPRHACLFVFPTIERWGVIWAFNGETPHYDLPGFHLPNERLRVKTLALPGTMPVDPWMQCANTPDIQHIRTLHGIHFESDPYDQVQWTGHSMRYDFDGFFDSGTRARWQVGIYGTSLYWQSAWLEGRWFGFMVPMGLVRPLQTRNYIVVAVEATDDAAADAAFCDLCVLTEIGIVGEDTGVFTTMRFQPGTMTRSDRVLGRYFDYLRQYPRAHPSAGWIS